MHKILEVSQVVASLSEQPDTTHSSIAFPLNVNVGPKSMRHDWKQGGCSGWIDQDLKTGFRVFSALCTASLDSIRLGTLFCC
jgi:hypothetical protein